MKIGTKIAAGFAVLISLLLVAQIYQVGLVHQIQQINSRLAGITFDSANESLELRRDLEQLEEFTEKYVVTHDPGYGSQLKYLRTACDARMEKLRSLDLSPRERADVERLVEIWEEFMILFQQLEHSFDSGRHSGLENLMPGLMFYFGQLRIQAKSIILEARDAVASEVDNTRGMSARAEWVSWLTTGFALAIGFLVSFFIVGSISRRVRQLTGGTHRLAQGDFSVQVEDTGRDEIALLARDFNSMVLRLKELDRLKRDFVSHVSHELKAPLASIQETTNILLDRLPGDLNEKQKRLLELNLKSGKRLSAMIGNLLDLSRMEAGAMEYDFEVVNLSSTVRHVVNDFAGLYREKQLKIETAFADVPVYSRIDEERFSQVVRNLLANAVNFSPGQGKISVCVANRLGLPQGIPQEQVEQLAAANGHFSELVVTDQGPGVPDEHKEKIFDKFHQVKQGRKISGQGTGLGLAISQKIVTAHGGAVWVEDNPEGGSVFRVLLPAEKRSL